MIQHYVIKFVSDLQTTGRWFSPGTPVYSTNKTDHHDIAELVLKVALNTINQPIESNICTVSSDCRFAFHRCCLFFQIIISILSY